MSARLRGPACVGVAICDHWIGTENWLTGSRYLQHGENPEHQRELTPGVMPAGMCADGHDLALEQWVVAVMEREGCIPKEWPEVQR